MAKTNLDKNLDALSEGLQSLADNLQNNTIVDTLDILTKSFNALSEGLVSDAKKMSREQITTITSTFDDITELLSQISTQYGKDIGFENLDVFINKFNKVMELYNEIEIQQNKIADRAGEIGQELFSGIDDAFNLIETLPGGKILSNALNLNEIKEQIQNTLINEIENAMLGMSSGFQSFGSLAIGILRGIGTAIWAILSNPITWVIAAIGLIVVALKNVWDMFTNVSEEAENLRTEMGLSGAYVEKLAIKMEAIHLGLTGLGIGMDEVVESVKGLINIFGNLSVLTDENIEATSIMIKQMGLTGDQAASLLMIFGGINDKSGESLLSMRKWVSTLSDAAGVAPGSVMADIAENAEFAYTYFRGNTKQIAQAAINARRLGLNLNSISGFIDSIMEFDSSLEKELEASLLLGRSIDFNKARYLAFQGDIEGATNEILKQVPALGEFNRLNFIQKKALADATGLSVEALTEAIQLQDKYNQNPGLREFEENQQQAMAKFSSAWKSIGSLIELLVEPAIELIAEGVNWISERIIRFTQYIRPFINSLHHGNGILESISGHFGYMINVIKDVYSWIKDKLSPIFKTIFDSNEFKQFHKSIKLIGTYFADMYEYIKPVIKAVGYLIGGTIGVALVGIGMLIKDLVIIFNNIVPPIVKILSGIVENITNIGKLIYGIFTFNTDMIKESINGIYSGFVKVYTGVLDFLEGVAKSIFDLITWPFTMAWDYISNLPIVSEIFGMNDEPQLAFSGNTGVTIPSITKSEQVSPTPIKMSTQTMPTNYNTNKELDNDAINRLIESNNAVGNKIDSLGNNMSKMQINIDGRKAGDLIGNSSRQIGQG